MLKHGRNIFKMKNKKTPIHKLGMKLKFLIPKKKDF